jgi:transketolase
VITMRQRFYEVAGDLLDSDARVAVVLAEIGAGELRPHPRLVNVGIREQLMVGVAAGLALEGLRPFVHSYATFLIERPFEQVKLDLVHQGVGAVLVSTGASYDGARSGRTHQAPADVALLQALPGWIIHVPGHPDEVERFVRRAAVGDDNVYVRLTEEVNAVPVVDDGLVVVRSGREGAALVVAVGPTLDPTLEATADLDVSVAYLATVRPFDADGLRAALSGQEVVLVEPYLAGTSAAEIAVALVGRPHRLLPLGVANEELRRYGTGPEHRALHGLDAAGIRRSIAAFLADSPHPGWGLPLTPYRRRYPADAHASVTIPRRSRAAPRRPA